MNRATQIPVDGGTDAGIAIAIADLDLRRQVLEALEGFSLPVIEENGAARDTEEIVTLVQRLRPRVLFLGLPGLSDDFAVVIARLAKPDSAPRIVAVSDSAEPELILKAMRSGAVEFLYPPFAQTAFAEAIRRVVADCRQDTHEERATGSVIGFVSAKGGCGATTMACHAASHLRLVTKKEILLADLDFSSGIVPSLMNAVARYSLDDAIQNLHRLDLKLWKALVATGASGVDVIPAPVETMSSGLPVSRKMPQLLRFWRMHYDLTLIDFGRGITPQMIDLLESIDTIVLVTTNEVPALRQARHMIQTLATRNFGANRLKLVVNRMPKRAQIQVPELEKAIGHPIYSAVPNDYQRVNDAYSEMKLVDKDSDLGTAMGKFATKLAGVATPEVKPRGLFGRRRSS